MRARESGAADSDVVAKVSQPKRQLPDMPLSAPSGVIPLLVDAVICTIPPKGSSRGAL
jgi:hypothetical protein